jgi:hypothetical protein
MCGMSRSQFWWLVVCFVGFFILVLREEYDAVVVAVAILGFVVWAMGATAIWLGGKLLRWWASR